MMNVRWSLVVAVGVLLTGGQAARADVTLPEVISNNMVLQKDIPLPIWGWADAGEEVSVTLGESTVNAQLTRLASGRSRSRRSRRRAVRTR